MDSRTAVSRMIAPLLAVRTLFAEVTVYPTRATNRVLGNGS